MDLLGEDVKKKVLETKTVPRHKCCSSPYWLYRIYQDTTIFIPEVIELISQALEESRIRILAPLYQDDYHISVLHPALTNLTCIEDPSKPYNQLWFSWNPPWNGAVAARYDVVTNNDHTIRYAKSNATSLKVTKSWDDNTLVIWFVRPVFEDGQVGVWSNVGKCPVGQN